MTWTAPQKPAEFAETRLIDAILDSHFSIGSTLPAERDLALQLGVTRPTLREALQRLARDGWLEIHQGRPTRVRDYWSEGNLGVLGAIARHSENLPPDFVPNLLFVRLLMAPAYASLAVKNAPEQIIALLSEHPDISAPPKVFATFDWQLHHRLTIASSNPIFTMILNGFRDLYRPMACLYFQFPDSRASSLTFYTELLTAAQERNAEAAEVITRQVMNASIALWHSAAQDTPFITLNSRDCTAEDTNHATLERQ
jgi:GntR family negative regulator for fad regulon and positive regulator of fabA